jgi:hypothetical protein
VLECARFAPLLNLPPARINGRPTFSTIITIPLSSPAIGKNKQRDIIPELANLVSPMRRIHQTLAALPVTWSGKQSKRETLAFFRWAKKVVPLNGSLSWLTPLDPPLYAMMAPYFAEGERRDQIATHFEKNVQDAQARGFTVPQIFLKFMRSRELRRHIPSYTACYFDAPDHLIEMDDGGVLFRFLNDQQWCLLWYLYLGPNQTQSIIASVHGFDAQSEQEIASEQSAHDDGDPCTWICAPNFESFLFRFWMANHIWFVEHEHYRELTELERKYTDHRDVRRKTSF